MIYVDVDDTFVRSVSTKRIPMPAVIAQVKRWKMEGASLYCWSSGGADYARRSAEEFGIGDCFVAFLPKPHVMVDDAQVGHWRLLHVYPGECDATLEELRATLDGR